MPSMTTEPGCAASRGQARRGPPGRPPYEQRGIIDAAHRAVSFSSVAVAARVRRSVLAGSGRARRLPDRIRSDHRRIRQRHVGAAVQAAVAGSEDASQSIVRGSRQADVRQVLDAARGGGSRAPAGGRVESDDRRGDGAIITTLGKTPRNTGPMRFTEDPLSDSGVRWCRPVQRVLREHPDVLLHVLDVAGDHGVCFPVLGA